MCYENVIIRAIKLYNCLHLAESTTFTSYRILQKPQFAIGQFLTAVIAGSL